MLLLCFIIGLVIGLNWHRLRRLTHYTHRWSWHRTDVAYWWFDSRDQRAKHQRLLVK
jgi:hypothetical protein